MRCGTFQPRSKTITDFSLKGLRILNTRPKHQAQGLTQAIQDSGGISIELPTLNIEPLSLEWLHCLPSLSHIPITIFVSANAVDYFFEGLQKAGIAWPATTITALAIGKATAKALAKHHTGALIVPNIPDSEHLLQLEILKHINCQAIIIVSGTASRPLIAQTLRNKGAIVSIIPVYKRTQPEKNLEMTHILWQDDAVDIILLFSQEAIAHLFDLFDTKAHAWIQSKPCIVISDRLADTAQRFGMRHITVTSYDNLLTTLASMIHDPRR